MNFDLCSAGGTTKHWGLKAARVSWRQLSFLGGSREFRGTIVGKT